MFSANHGDGLTSVANLFDASVTADEFPDIEPHVDTGSVIGLGWGIILTDGRLWLGLIIDNEFLNGDRSHGGNGAGLDPTGVQPARVPWG